MSQFVHNGSNICFESYDTYRETSYSKCSKCLLLALRHALKQSRHWSIAWSMKFCSSLIPRFNQILLQLIDVPLWFLINMFLYVCCTMWFSCSQEWNWMMHISVISCCSNSCGRLLLSSAPRVRKRTELLRHTTLDFTPKTWPPNRPDLNPVDYRIWTVVQECVYQKQQGTLNIVDELRLSIDWHFINGHIVFHKVG